MMRSFSTIVSSSYLPQAEVLIESFKNNHPNDLFYLLLIDVYPREDKIIDGVTLLTPEEIGIATNDLVAMRRYYDVVEFATSLKPFLLTYLLKLGHSEATFLDPDIKIFSEIPSTFTAESEDLLSLTPHRLSPPVNGDGLNLETSFLKYGTFNLGYISVKNVEKTSQFLEWWQEKLISTSTRRAISDVFTDQKWINLVPGYFQFTNVQDFGFNVAPWNLDERELSWENGRLMVNVSSEVKFVHFSQISQMLAADGLTPDWELKLGEAGSSFQSRGVFSELLRVYSLELKKASTSGKFSKQMSLLHEPYSNLNYLLRSRLATHPKGSTGRRLIFRAINPLLDKLTRLDLFKGLFWGLESDLRRLKKKYKSKNSITK